MDAKARTLVFIYDTIDPVVEGFKSIYREIENRYGVNCYPIPLPMITGLKHARDFIAGLGSNVIHYYVKPDMLVKLLLAHIIAGAPDLIIVTEKPGGSRAYLVVSFLLDILRRRGVKVLLFYPTTYEEKVLGKILGSMERYSIDVYYTERKPSLPLELLSTEPLIILVPMYTSLYEGLGRLVSILRGVGLNVKIVVIGRKCFRNPYILCIETNMYYDFIRNVSLAFIPYGDSFSNKNILELVNYGKPVIASSNSSIAYSLLDTGLVYIVDKIDPDSIASEVINVVNRLDIHKKILVNLQPITSDIREVAEKTYRIILKTLI